MASLLERVKVKNLEQEENMGGLIYKMGVFAGNTEIGSVSTDLDDYLTISLSNEDTAILSQELEDLDGEYKTVREYLPSLVEKYLSITNKETLLEIPRNILREHVLETPEDKYNSFAILYIDSENNGNVVVYKTEHDTQNETIENLIRKVGVENKESKNAKRILGFHYASLRKIETTEIL